MADDYYQEIAKNVPKNVEIWHYYLQNQDKQDKQVNQDKQEPFAKEIKNLCTCKILKSEKDSQEVEFQSPRGEIFRGKLNLGAAYNAENALAAWTTCLALGLNPKLSFEALAKLKPVPGRLNSLKMTTVDNQSCEAIIDYAHTPLALESILKHLSKQTKEAGSRLFVLCNSTGDREKEKRPLMAKICQKYADICILTLEDIGKEEVKNILLEIARGFSPDYEFYFSPLRQDAIRFALSQMRDKDILLLPALGDQQSCFFDDISYTYNEHSVCTNLMSEEAMRRHLIKKGLKLKPLELTLMTKKQLANILLNSNSNLELD